MTETEPTKSYAVYDETLQRFVTGVLPKKDAETAAKDGPEGHALVVRAV